MKLIKGKYNTAKVFTDVVEDTATDQIKALCSKEIFKDSEIRIMPDVHAGAGCVIGTTMTIDDAIVPNMVGVDIGCGVDVYEITPKALSFDELDEAIRRKIPTGFNIRETELVEFDIKQFYCAGSLDQNKVNRAIGTLGGGNHFIEVSKGTDGRMYLLIHSGSRNLGFRVAKYYQDVAKELEYKRYKTKRENVIKTVNKTDISSELEKVKRENDGLEYLKYDDYMLSYFHDMRLAQEYATKNRRIISEEIDRELKLNAKLVVSTKHNYIGKDYILRKGAVSANKFEMFVVPLDMKNGSLICMGLGNKEWNFSAPHGAGRKMSRTEAKRNIKLKDYKAIMEGVFSTTVNENTLDECPMAYKGDISDKLKDTATIIDILKPVYNFKDDTVGKR